jgi:hypothetical protein
VGVDKCKKGKRGNLFQYQVHHQTIAYKPGTPLVSLASRYFISNKIFDHLYRFIRRDTYQTEKENAQKR